MTYPTMSQLYPEIADMIQNPAFHLSYRRSMNSGHGGGFYLNLSSWSHFWNLLGARRMCNGYTCVVCGVRFSKKHRKNKVDMLCTHHLRQKNATRRALR